MMRKDVNVVRQPIVNWGNEPQEECIDIITTTSTTAERSSEYSIVTLHYCALPVPWRWLINSPAECASVDCRQLVKPSFETGFWSARSFALFFERLVLFSFLIGV